MMRRVGFEPTHTGFKPIKELFYALYNNYYFIVAIPVVTFVTVNAPYFPKGLSNLLANTPTLLPASSTIAIKVSGDKNVSLYDINNSAFQSCLS